MDMYEWLETGIQYDEALVILETAGTERSSNEIAGIKTAMYEWRNPDGSNVNAIFQNGKLIQKAQFGLK